MTNPPPYFIKSLTLSGFRAYLQPKMFDFKTKRSLAIFGANASGKTSIVDAVEFFFSRDGTLERLGLKAIHNQAGPVALAHHLAADCQVPSAVEVKFKRGADLIEGSRNASGQSRPRPDAAATVKTCFAVDPIVRGYSLRRFVEEQKAEERYAEVAG